LGIAKISLKKPQACYAKILNEPLKNNKQLSVFKGARFRLNKRKQLDFFLNLKENIPSQYSKTFWKKTPNLGESLGAEGEKKIRHFGTLNLVW